MLKHKGIPAEDLPHIFGLLMEDVEEQLIRDYIHGIRETCQRLEPVLFYLYQPDYSKTMRRICDYRGERWEKWLIERSEKSAFAQTRNLKGFDGMDESRPVGNHVYRAGGSRRDRIYPHRHERSRSYRGNRGIERDGRTDRRSGGTTVSAVRSSGHTACLYSPDKPKPKEPEIFRRTH